LYFKERDKVRKKPSKGFLAIAPSYNPQIIKDSFGLSVLRYNKEEAQKAAGYFRGKMLLSEEATKPNFLRVASKFNILHLAMHAQMNDEQPMLSNLLLSSSMEEEDQSLYTYELYGLDLTAELTVLSACNTGAGKMVRGEGIMSLARAFQYAGCPNIITSLWTVDDQSTAELMDLFYEALVQDQNKGHALKIAKQRYLEQADPLFSHPFYWAGFILIGDNQPVSRVVNFPSWGYILIGVGLVLLIFLVSESLSRKWFLLPDLPTSIKKG